MNNVALIFPGQGSQYLGMCSDDLFKRKSYKLFFDNASDLFGEDILDYCINGPVEKLNSTYIAQPAILIHSIILDTIIKKNNLEIKAVAGHSLGEYTALISAGVISYNDCMKILKVRCTEMQKANQKYDGSMLAVIHNDIKQVQNICNLFSQTVIANINSQNQIIISGPKSEIEKSIKIFKDNNINKLIKLNVSGAFHSPLMAEANVSLNKVINSVNFNNAKYAVYQNVSTKNNFDGNEIKKNLMKQLTGTVNWLDIINNMAKNKIETIIELGPKNVLSRLVKKIHPNFNVINIDNLNDLNSNGFNLC